MKRPTIALVFAASVTLLAACGSNDTTQPVSKVITFKATLSGAAERPNPVTSSGTGTFTATLDTSTNVFIYDVTYSGLGSNVTLGHIHGPATADAAGGAILNFASSPGALSFTIGATSGTAKGQTTLTAATQFTTGVNGDSLRKLLLAGLTYANIHTATFGGGEVRGQITKQ